MRNIVLSFLVCTIVLCTPDAVSAGPILRSGQTISVDATQVLKGDFYGFGSTVTISGKGENDVYVGGGTITINAPIVEDLVILGGVVQVHDSVGDDLRILGGEVTLGSSVAGDVVVVGGTLIILSTATIEGDVLFTGGNLIVEGKVVGGIHARAESVRINGEIGGDVSLTTQSSSLGDKAIVLGDITYDSATSLVRAQGADIRGEIQKIESGEHTKNDFYNMFFLWIGMLIFLSLSIHLIARNHIRKIVNETTTVVGTTGLIGLGVFLGFPFVGGILMISMLGILVGVLVLISYVFLLLIANVLSIVFIGNYVQKNIFRWDKQSPTLMTVCIGMLFYVGMSAIPFIGGFIIFAIMIISLGSISRYFYQALHSR